MIPKLDDYKSKWQLESTDMIKPGLEAITNALKLLDHPEKKLQVVHIAGTNGKGSTLTFLEQIARLHGLSVGKFMSPCIVDVHDQIQINGQPISEQELDAIFKVMKKAGLHNRLTDFELLTCVAFLQFARKKVDLVLLEAGMGGREDSTNVIVPIVSIIPSIALEHTKFLGNTIESIAAHKAGIIKIDTPVVIGRLPEDALTIIQKEASEKNAPLRIIGEHFEIEASLEGDSYSNHEKGITISQLERKLPGRHQGDNMALAITAFFEVADHFQLTVETQKLRDGVRAARLPGRFEQVWPNIYFDGAHNPASAQKLVDTLQAEFPNNNIRFVIGMLADKDVATVLSIFETISDEFYFVDFSNERAMEAENMIGISKAAKKCILNKKISDFTHCEGITVVTGSLYLLTELRGRQEFL
ncbi:bifunctional folylpolyglutamate synthase/dihydrofolate synthase [Lysinibacillus antri]|uniref:tetrahydrofolate synthase n=1 Tax=Lysinibacillus antri TaxID=2498145 RepID=A0A432LA97_9BACI|nr:folylpolyglutamate synthase/dihydrofolate synthase family protein [Lysinibacillus antri]RUL51062.1 bifunctional folylpolyglutamate synthase/dihydrofolate synthase [Lysinibacillus antri]